MTHMILAPTGLLRTRTKAYGQVHRELRRAVREQRQSSDKRAAKIIRSITFKRKGELIECR